VRSGSQRYSGDPRHVVEELLGRIRAESVALDFLFREVDQPTQILGAVVDDAE